MHLLSGSNVRGGLSLCCCLLQYSIHLIPAIPPSIVYITQVFVAMIHAKKNLQYLSVQQKHPQASEQEPHYLKKRLPKKRPSTLCD